MCDDSARCSWLLVRMRVRDRYGEKTANSWPSYKFVQANLIKSAATVCSGQMFLAAQPAASQMHVDILQNVCLGSRRRTCAVQK